MFSAKEKQMIAAAVEKVLLEINHPEMPKERPAFKLRVDGKRSWSWADIEPNWKYDKEPPTTTDWNEEEQGHVFCGQELLARHGVEMGSDVDSAGPAEALVSCLRLDDIAPLLIAWQQTREAICSVETSQPYQMSAAMTKLIAAREEMERSVNALLPLISR